MEQKLGVWLRDGTSIYMLHETTDRFGRPRVENRFYMKLMGAPSEWEEAEAEAKRIHALLLANS